MVNMYSVRLPDGGFEGGASSRRKAPRRHFEFEIFGGKGFSSLAIKTGRAAGHHRMRLLADCRPLKCMVHGASACQKVSHGVCSSVRVVACSCMVVFA